MEDAMNWSKRFEVAIRGENGRITAVAEFATLDEAKEFQAKYGGEMGYKKA